MSTTMMMQAPQEKINRELFVGNTPPGTSEALLLQFMNAAMRRVGLADGAPQSMPLVSCRVNQKFAFVECSTPDMATRALQLNGIPFLGAVLKVSRPSKYSGTQHTSQTWQELTGVPLPTNLLGGRQMNTNTMDPAIADKVNRELFIGNTTPEMTDGMIQEFLGNAMMQVGLNIQPGNPIAACRVSGKFAFIELRTKEEAANALNLNNIPFMGAQLRVGRPSKYNGPTTPHGNWEDILAKYMSGELSLPSQQQQAAAGGDGAKASAAATAGAPPSKVVELRNMLTNEDLQDESEYNDILADTREECSQFGALSAVIIPRATEPGATKIFLEYAGIDDAAKAIQGLAGRTFDGRKVEAAYFDETKFANKEF